jgi:hypothetical protein
LCVRGRHLGREQQQDPETGLDRPDLLGGFRSCALTARVLQPDRTGPRSPAAGLLDEGDLGTDEQTAEGVVKNALLFEIHLVPVSGFQVSVRLARNQADDTSTGLACGNLRLVPDTAFAILQSAPGDVERIANSHPRARLRSSARSSAFRTRSAPVVRAASCSAASWTTTTSSPGTESSIRT